MLRMTKNRRDILNYLATVEAPQTPSQVTTALDDNLPNIIRSLAALAAYGSVIETEAEVFVQNKPTATPYARMIKHYQLP